MKKWNEPSLQEIGIKSTNELYVDECNWDGAETVEAGNGDYTYRNNKQLSILLGYGVKFITDGIRKITLNQVNHNK